MTIKDSVDMLQKYLLKIWNCCHLKPNTQETETRTSAESMVGNRQNMNEDTIIKMLQMILMMMKIVLHYRFKFLDINL